MMNLLYILLLMSLSCTNRATQTDNATGTDSTKNILNKTGNSKYYATKDSIIIFTESWDSLKYSKEEFNELIDEHPEFFYDFPISPDLLYYSYGDHREFSSEVGQDNYYLLYAYFIKQKNSLEKYTECRNKVTAIYDNINSLFGYFQYGGTYFAHQGRRIHGYAEYAVYEYSKVKDSFEKTYNISKQKEFYIKSLRQLAEDESSIDFNVSGEEKIKRTKEINALVDSLDKLITDNFYLRKAQEFHYDHYQYY